jgi:hypothetical protein
MDVKVGILTTREEQRHFRVWKSVFGVKRCEVTRTEEYKTRSFTNFALDLLSLGLSEGGLNHGFGTKIKANKKIGSRKLQKKFSGIAKRTFREYSDIHVIIDYRETDVNLSVLGWKRMTLYPTLLPSVNQVSVEKGLCWVIGKPRSEECRI